MALNKRPQLIIVFIVVVIAVALMFFLLSPKPNTRNIENSHNTQNTQAGNTQESSCFLKNTVLAYFENESLSTSDSIKETNQIIDALLVNLSNPELNDSEITGTKLLLMSWYTVLVVVEDLDYQIDYLYNLTKSMPDSGCSTDDMDPMSLLFSSNELIIVDVASMIYQQAYASSYISGYADSYNKNEADDCVECDYFEFIDEEWAKAGVVLENASHIDFNVTIVRDDCPSLLQPTDSNTPELLGVGGRPLSTLLANDYLKSHQKQSFAKANRLSWKIVEEQYNLLDYESSEYHHMFKKLSVAELVLMFNEGYNILRASGCA